MKNRKYGKSLVLIVSSLIIAAFVFGFRDGYAEEISQTAAMTQMLSDNVVTDGIIDVASGTGVYVTATDSAVKIKPRINTKTKKMSVGEKYKLKIINIDKNVKVEWKSSNESVVSVTNAGKIHAKHEGNAVISATADGKKYKCKIKVSKKGFEFAEYVLGEGDTLTMHIKAGKKTSWSISGNALSIIQKKNGFIRVKGIKQGKAYIKAKSNGVTYYCNVRVKKENKSVIYLTFDDGPSTTSTPKILSILKKNGVNATFFVINYSDQGEKLIKREVEEGNAIAIHGYSHDYATIYRSEAAYLNNIKKLQDKLYKTLGYRVWATRFPGGSSNLVSRNYSRGIMSKLVKKVEELGYEYFDWNVSSSDAGGATNSSQVYSSVIKGLKKNRNNIVLMHDFSNNNKTIGALDSIIKYGKANGYAFKVINNSTVPVHHGVQN